LERLVHSTIEKWFFYIATGIVSLLSVIAIIGWADGLSPSESLAWLLAYLGQRSPSWLTDGVAWLQEPGRRTMAIPTCLLAGGLVSAGALERGPLREGGAAILGWALIVPAAEIVGLGTAVVYAGCSFLFVLLLAVACAEFGPEDLWSRRTVRNAASKNVGYFLHIPLLIPMMGGWLLRAYSNRQEPN
jgi:hypothetical protein